MGGQGRAGRGRGPCPCWAWGHAALGRQHSHVPPCRQKILKEKAVPMIEGYMFEEHELIRLAATECMCNMAMSKEVRAGLGGLRVCAAVLVPCTPLPPAPLHPPYSSTGTGAVPGRGQ